MDPYLEQDDVWQDFHQSFIPLARELLSEQVRPNYIVKVEEHLFIHDHWTDEQGILGRADVSVAREAPPASSRRETAALLQPPVSGRLPIAVDVERHGFLEIRDRRSRELITVIELLSPSNKRPGPDRDQYLAKRRQLAASNAHLVEIDLLRGGPRLPIEGLPPCDYYALVSRADERPQVGLWPVQLRERLPVIPIPLRSPDPDATLDLQIALNRVYEAAGYEDYIYSSLPQPPLESDDAKWAAAVLKNRQQ